MGKRNNKFKIKLEIFEYTSTGYLHLWQYSIIGIISPSKIRH